MFGDDCTVQDEDEKGKGESGMAQTEQWEGWWNGMDDFAEGLDVFVKGLGEFVGALNVSEDVDEFLVGGRIVLGGIDLAWVVVGAGI